MLYINHFQVEAHIANEKTSPRPQIRVPSSPSLGRLAQSPKGDQQLVAWLTVLRTTIEKLLDTIGYYLDPRPRPVFLINNYDLILTVLQV